MDLFMSALTLCAHFVNYEPLIITMLNRAKTVPILPSFPAVTLYGTGHSCVSVTLKLCCQHSLLHATPLLRINWIKYEEIGCSKTIVIIIFMLY